jgi:hypothetical protein
MSSNDSSGQLVVAEGLRVLVEANRFAQAVRDVAQVGQQRGTMAIEDLAVQLVPLAAADAVDEVAEMEPPQVGEPAGRSALDRLALPRSLGKELPFLDRRPRWYGIRPLP